MNWNETKNIFISWVASPLLTGLVAFIIFALIRFFILLSANPFSRGYYTFSVILFITLAIDAFFIFNKGTKNFTYFHENIYDDKWVIPTCLGIGALVGLLWLWPIGPYAKRRLQAKRDEREAARATQAIVDANKQSSQPLGANEQVKGKQFAGEYDPEEGSIKFSLNEPIDEVCDERESTQRVENRSFKRKINSLSELGTSLGSIKICVDESIQERLEDADNKSFKRRLHNMSDQIGISIKEALDTSFTKQIEAQMHPMMKKKKKKNILIRFEEATFKQDLQEQAFQESKDTQECWQAAETYDAEVEALYTYVQAFTAALRLVLFV